MAGFHVPLIQCICSSFITYLPFHRGRALIPINRSTEEGEQLGYNGHVIPPCISLSIHVYVTNIMIPKGKFFYCCVITTFVEYAHLCISFRSVNCAVRLDYWS